MIDLEKAKIEFEEYVDNYDSKNIKIKRKINHSYRVVSVAETIAKSLKISSKDVELAKLIGLLHDIGRFEQIRIYNTFSDRDSIDHANLGVEILFKDNFIRKFIDVNEYDEIIYKSIKNHNKYNIEEGLNEKELLHAKIIRDADKTDIYEIYLEDMKSNENEIFNYDNLSKEIVSDEVIEYIEKKELVDRKYTKNNIDRYVSALAFVFDYNFVKGLKIVNERQYIKKLINRIKTEKNKGILEKIENNINEYINKKIY